MAILFHLPRVSLPEPFLFLYDQSLEREGLEGPGVGDEMGRVTRDALETRNRGGRAWAGWFREALGESAGDTEADGSSIGIWKPDRCRRQGKGTPRHP